MSSWNWQRPKLRTDADEHRERRTSWLELFYDLAFVAVIAQLSTRLSHQPTWAGVGEFVAMMTPVWWVWIGGTFYNERFETEDLSQRVFTLLQMIPLATMAGAIHGGFGDTSRYFAWSYVAARSVLVVMWLRGGWHNPVARPMTDRFALGFLISIALWTASVYVPAPARVLLWAAGLLIDLLTPITTLKFQAQLPAFSMSRLHERFGLFVVIVLGEAVVAIVEGIAHLLVFTPLAIGTVTLTLVVVFSLWWVYFDHVMGRIARPPFWRQAIWSYSHLPLLMALVAFAAGVAQAVELGMHDIPSPIRWLIAGSLAVVLLSLGVIEWTLYPRGAGDRSPMLRAVVRFVAAALVLALGPGWIPGGVLGLMLGILVCMVGQIFDGWILHGRVRADAERELAPSEAGA